MTKLIMMAVTGLLSLNLFTGAGAEDGNAQRGRFPEKVRERIEVVSEVLGIKPREIARELRDGATIEELAQAQGIELVEVSDAIAEPRRERLAEEVTEGLLTREQADYLNGQADERLSYFLTMPPRQALHQSLLEEFAQVVGLSVADVQAQIEAGSRPAEIVGAQGLDAGQVIEEMVALRGAKLDERVVLDLMTATQQRGVLAAYEEMLTRRLAE